MIDTSYIKVHQNGTGTKGVTRTWGAQKGAQLKDTSGRGCAWYAGRMVITSGTVADCTQSCELMEGFDAGYILAGRGYDSNSFIEYIEEHGMEAVIPPRKN